MSGQNGMQEFVGAVIVEFDSVEYEAIGIKTKTTGDKKLVKTMNRARRPKGRVLTIPEHTLNVTIPIPVQGEPDWLAFDNGKVTIQSVEGGKRETYQGCFVTEMSADYKVEGEAVRDLTISALNRIFE